MLLNRPGVKKLTPGANVYKLLFCAADDGIVCVGSNSVNDDVKQGENQCAYCRRQKQQAEVIKSEEQKKLVYHREGKAEVDYRKQQRQE